MKILIHGGPLHYGLNSPGGGEGRYALNMAESFALQGHEIYLWGSGGYAYEPPKWGTQKPIPGIKMCTLQEIEGQQFDLLLNCPLEYQNLKGQWLKSGDLRINCKKKVICLFSWNESIENNLVDNYLYGKIENFVIGHPYPYKQTEANRIPIAWVPFPFFNQDISINTNKYRNGITWACKNAFSDEWGEDKPFHASGAKILEAIQKLSTKHDLVLNYINSETLKGNRAERFGATRSIKDIPKKVLAKHMVSYDVMLDWLTTSRLSIILPGYSGAFFDAVGRGCFALFHEEDGPGTFASMVNTNYRINMNMSVDDIYNKIEPLFTNEFLFKELTAIQYKALTPYSYSESYKQSLKSLDLNW